MKVMVFTFRLGSSILKIVILKSSVQKDFTYVLIFYNPSNIWGLAVDQQTKAHNRTFEVVLDSGSPPVPAGQPRPYLVNFWLNFAKSP